MNARGDLQLERTAGLPAVNASAEGDEPRDVGGSGKKDSSVAASPDTAIRVLDGSEKIIYDPLTMTQRLLSLAYLYFLAHAGGLDV